MWLKALDSTAWSMKTVLMCCFPKMKLFHGKLENSLQIIAVVNLSPSFFLIQLLLLGIIGISNRLGYSTFNGTRTEQQTNINVAK